MRTTIIPAQITTIEDKIAGSLSLTQILILIIPIFWTAIIYVGIGPTMKITPLKISLVLVVLFICLVLIIRIKDKIVADWLKVIVRYQSRPRYWLYNKNDLTNRIVDMPVEVVTPKTEKVVATQPSLAPNNVNVAELVKLEQLIRSGNVALRYQFNQK
jgi:hypothetical protein